MSNNVLNQKQNEKATNKGNSFQEQNRPRGTSRQHYKPLLPHLKFDGLLAKYINVSAYPLLAAKTVHCQHEGGCVAHLFDISVQGFSIGFATMQGINTLLATLKSLAKGKLTAVLRALFSFQNSKDAFNFALFPLVYNFVLQASSCALRKILNGQTGSNAFLSGALAGFFALMTRQSNNRVIWGVFLLSRAFECFYNSLINRRIIPKVPYDWVFIFALMWIFEGYNFQYEPNNCPPSIMKFGNFVTNQNEADSDYGRAVMVRKGRQLLEKYGRDVAITNPRLVLPYTKKQLALKF